MKDEWTCAIPNLIYGILMVHTGGHVHAYERILPIYRNQTEHSYNNPTGLPQLVVGGPGNMEGLTQEYEHISLPLAFRLLQHYHSTALASPA